MNENPLAESIAHFLYWSGWLEQHDSNAVYGITMECDGYDVQMGTSTFERLLASLEKECPHWRELNANYRLKVDSE